MIRTPPLLPVPGRAQRSLRAPPEPTITSPGPPSQGRFQPRPCILPRQFGQPLVEAVKTNERELSGLAHRKNIYGIAV